MAINEVIIPDIGGATDVDVVEVMVAVGDVVKEEDALISLESDKATMEVPAPFAGVIKEMKVAVGDKVSEGAVIMVVETGAAASEKAPAQPVEATKEEGSQSDVEVVVPDIGGAENVDVIEVHVKPGSTIAEEDSLITLESDKASMDVPAPYAGQVKDVKVKVGDKVSEGTIILTVTTGAKVAAAKPTQPEPAKAAAPTPPIEKEVVVSKAAENSAVDSSLHASPVVRRLATEFGIDLNQVPATGNKGRITKEDVQQFVKSRLASANAGGGFSMPQAPVVDFSQFGDVERQSLNKIKRLTGEFLSRNWMMIPHVTQFDEADITDMEAFRKQNKVKAEKAGVKLTPLAFIMKAVVAALKAFPSFNASLSPDGQELILKKYFHVGVAVDTPNGLVVPVVRDVDQKGVYDLARELGEISKKARDKKLLPKDMQGGCITISSLGGIGGTAFTPIVNAPEVAIVGVSRSQMKPVYVNGEFVPRLMLPLSISYDHRVIDGAEGARFTTYLSSVLSDLRQIIL